MLFYQLLKYEKKRFNWNNTYPKVNKIEVLYKKVNILCFVSFFYLWKKPNTCQYIRGGNKKY